MRSDVGCHSPRVALALCSLAAPALAQRADWQFGPFVKPAAVNPVIVPSRATTFLSPMNDSIVRWEEFATFNPAAVVKDGKVYVLYRAEDASGEAKIGMHTSRLGLAESADGLHFTRRAAPVLYPGKDEQRSMNGPRRGGPAYRRDRRRTYVLTYTQWNRHIPPRRRNVT
jgi:predicted GH43/DUF377 family glycosyl hydrolase